MTERIAYRQTEVAKMLGTSPHVIANAINRGELKARRIGRCVLIPATALEAFINGEAMTPDEVSNDKVDRLLKLLEDDTPPAA